jgi:hypothetical protein
MEKIDANELCVLYVNGSEPNCGVHQFGRAIAKALAHSRAYRFVYRAVTSPQELHEAVAEARPAAIIYNYHPATMPWLERNTIAGLDGPQIGTIHEITQAVANVATNQMFHYHIAADPTLLLKNPIVFKTGRLLPKYQNKFPRPVTPVIGTWGFGYAGKGFERVVRTVQDEFDEATIRLHMPLSPFMDADGTQASAIAARCSDLVAKPGIKLIVSHEFLSTQDMLDLLAQNTLNAFFYAENPGRGISSVLDLALAAGRPVALTRSFMFRHLFEARPSIFVEDRSLREIIASDIEPLRRFRSEWTAENMIWDYERIVGKALAAHQAKSTSAITSIKRKVRARQLRFFQRLNRRLSFEIEKLGRRGARPWLTDGAESAYRPCADPIEQSVFTVSPDGPRRYNRILDNTARRMYGPTIALLFSLVPDIMERKIPLANVQQAFVFDAVRTLAPPNARILCIGSFEDTACMGLKTIGLDVEEIDPLINYDLDEFLRRPSTLKGSYDVVFATSVLEHVEDDATFMRNISDLLKPDGVAVLTCDYNDQYKIGDPIPSVCHRMYTQMDLSDRIIPSARNCSLVDIPDWNCPDPDFVLAGRFRYTFATIVLRKIGN